MKTKIPFITALILIVFNAVAQGQSNNIEDITRNFMTAYSGKDFDKMATFYHDSIRYLDPTSAAFGTTLDLHGKEEFVATFKKLINQDFTTMAVSIKSMFVVGELAVINTLYEATIIESYFGKTGKSAIKISILMTTVLEFKGTKILNHTDYVNYTEYNKQVAKQLNQK